MIIVVNNPLGLGRQPNQHLLSLGLGRCHAERLLPEAPDVRYVVSMSHRSREGMRGIGFMALLSCERGVRS